MMDEFVNVVIRVIAVIAISMLSRRIGFDDGRRKGFLMTVWAIENGYIEVKPTPDGKNLVVMTEKLSNARQ